MFLDLFEFRRWPFLEAPPGVPSMYAAYGFFKKLLAGKRFDTDRGGRAAVHRRHAGSMGDECGAGDRHPQDRLRGRCVHERQGEFGRCSKFRKLKSCTYFPSCGDESNSIGAACHLAAQAGERIQPLGRALLRRADHGPGSGDGARGHPAGWSRFRYGRAISRACTAEKLAEGKIVARAKGAGGIWRPGAGNRSILARADSPTAVRSDQ